MDEVPKQENNGSKRPMSHDKMCKLSFILGCILGVFALAGNAYMSYSIISLRITGVDSLIGAVVAGMAYMLLGFLSGVVTMAAIVFTYNGIKLYKVATIIVMSILSVGLLCITGVMFYVFIL